MSEPSPLPIPVASLPAHIAIIMDGNGRWAQERGLSRSEGHKAGVRAAKAIVTECRTLGIRHLTLYTFSQENWGRPKALRHAMNRTAKCSDMIVNLALNYSGREEILRAARLLMQQGVKPEAVTEEAFRSCLYSAGQPDPDLIIRTSGEQRISNYLTFQSAYSELYFTSTYWPDFTPEALHRALVEYAGRNRRFGLTQEQIQ